MISNENSIDLETWRSFARPFFDVVATDAPEDFRAHVRSTKCGRLIVSEVGFDGAVFDHDPRRHDEFDNGYLLLERYSSGENRGRVGEVDTRLDPGAIHCIDMSRPYRTQASAAECQSVVIPHDLVGYVPDRHDGYARLDAASPRGAMLAAAMTALFEAGDGLDDDDAAALGDSFAGVVRRLLLGASDREMAERRRDGDALLLRRYIDDHLADPELDPGQLCAVLGVSRAGLYRLFEDQGGVRRHIVASRLDRCFDELREGPRRHGRVREVAERWGFYDSKSFNRSFRARFGIAPSDCLDWPRAGVPGRGAGPPRPGVDAPALTRPARRHVTSFF